MPRLRVAMNPLMGLLFFGVGVFNFYVYAVTHDNVQLAIGALMLLFGALYVFGAVLVVDGGFVMVKNAYGMTVRTFAFASPHDLELSGRTLWVTTTDGDRKKVSGLLAAGRDWRALAAAIADARATSPPPAK